MVLLLFKFRTLSDNCKGLPSLNHIMVGDGCPITPHRNRLIAPTSAAYWSFGVPWLRGGYLSGWAVCVLIIRLISNIHQHRFACMLTSTKAFLYEVTFCSPFKTGNRSSGCWLLRKEMILLGELTLCIHTVVSSCLVCLRAAQTIHLLVVNLMAQYWRNAKEQNTSLWCQRDSFPDFMNHKYR